MWNFIWNNIIVNPMTNLLLFLYDALNNNFLLALIVFTALIRLAMLPLNIRNQRVMMRTQEMQPTVQKIQKKYRDDPVRMQEEFKKIGYNPAESLGGCLPMLLQMPIFFGLYRAIGYVLSSSPKALSQLSERAYDWVDLTSLLPIKNTFAWLNLSQPDPWFILPFVVAGTSYVQQKFLTASSANANKKGDDNNPAAAMQKQMLVMMPLMMGFIALSFPAGLSIYFIVSNLIGMLQGYIMQKNRQKLQDEKDASKGKKQKKSAKK